MAALFNCYLPPNVNTNKDCEIAQKMLLLSGKSNYLQNPVLSDKALSHRSKAWILIKDYYESIPTFPKISEDEIRSLTFGVYQVRQAASYIDEYICGSNSIIYFRNQHQTLCVLGWFLAYTRHQGLKNFSFVNGHRSQE